MSADQAIESWKDIEGYPGYQVSDAGHIRTCRPKTRADANGAVCWPEIGDSY